MSFQAPFPGMPQASFPQHTAAPQQSFQQPSSSFPAPSPQFPPQSSFPQPQFGGGFPQPMPGAGGFPQHGAGQFPQPAQQQFHQEPQYSVPPPNNPSFNAPTPQFGGNSVADQFGQMSMNSGPSPAFPQQGMMPQQGGGMMPTLGGAAPFSNEPALANVIPVGVKPCHPTYMTHTIGGMPVNKQLADRACIPMGVVVHPMSDPPEGDPPLPVINFGVCGVIRCKVCRAYINPYVQFMDGGKSWRCNLCMRHNDVPSGYYAGLDGNGRRVDLDQRVELNQSSVEIVASAEYTVRNPMPPSFVFCIDVSQRAVQCGMLMTVVESIKASLDTLPGGKRTRIGFITFDSAVHLYALRAGSQPSMHVLPDLEDIFLPVPENLLVNLEECRDCVDQLLESLVRMHENTANVEVCLGPALEAAIQVMGRIGGKLLVFTSGLPSVGEGRLVNREDARMIGGQNEHVLLQPSMDFYAKKGVKFTRYQISVDVFMFPDQFCDVITLNDLCKNTGGQPYYYPQFTAETDGERCRAELMRNLTRTTGWEAVLRVRCSQGVSISAFHGNFFLRGTDLLALPTVDSDKAFAIEISHSEANISTPSLSTQCALLYTTSSGERRIRVHTSCIPILQSIPQAFPLLNTNTVVALLAKQAVQLVYVKGFQKARELLQNTCINVIRAYTKSEAQFAQAGQGMKALPDNLNTLPLMTLGLIKCLAFVDSPVRTDRRASVLCEFSSMSVSTCETVVRPRLLPVHAMQDQEGLLDETGAVDLPLEVSLSETCLTSDGAFLLDNGFGFYLRIGNAISSEWLQDVLGIASMDGINIMQLQVRQPEDANDTSSTCARLQNIFSYLRELSPYHQQVHLIREGDPSEEAFRALLIEDRTAKCMSLTEFAHHINAASSTF